MMEQKTEESIVDEQQRALETINELMTKPRDFYNSERHPNEIDLVACVREMLVRHGLGDRLPACYDNNRFILDAMNRPADAQKYNLNRYLNLQLMAAEQDTSVERYALIYEVRPDHWLIIFEKTILPALINYNLPVQI